MLIAECGNCHYGSIDTAKKMIIAARECGADAVKFQAFKAADIKHGSMPKKFYERCEFTEGQYFQLINYGVENKVPVFFSVFNKSFSKLHDAQRYKKVAGNQIKAANFPFKIEDEEDWFISVPWPIHTERYEKANILYVSEYLTDQPQIWRINEMRSFYKRPIGYSDHTIGINWVIDAIKYTGVKIVEKHFTLNKDKKWNNKVFRDNIHAADQVELTRIARAMK